MKSKDLLKQELTQKFATAMQSENQEDMINAFVEFATGVQEEVLQDFREYQQTQDKEILQKRGIHQLTQQETKFYQAWIDAAKDSNPRQAITNLNIALPETVIDNVMVDMKAAHHLLEMIEFQNMTTLTKMLINKKGIQLAKWGKISSAITKELEGAIGKLDLSLNKLTAFMPVAKDMLLVGPQWIDAYVRTVLSEAVAYGLEEGIINGTGVDMPIGMNRDIHEGVSFNTSTGYPKKKATKITDLSPKTFGNLLATLAKDPVDEKKARVIDNLIMIVNPFDYYKKVMPATTIQLQDGNYKNNVLPYPTTIIQSTQISEGEAILGIAKKYAMGIGTGSQDGVVEYSDDYKFLEDERYYIIKLIGNGQALDDNAFLLLDISGLEDMTMNVKVKGTVTTKAQA
ncbi:phage major capsid protein [Clostridium botulinum]|uniref:phage major capsid protein n=1 Tax=Clostridium botulinum TaxID=1491 RepID=UPI0004D9DFA5|nr:phage major capsid protein [Clostridium botulinum]KEI01571.1 mAjor capsid protein a [Clostridium botulinum C/D str. BKT75002]KEI07905.1 mAjor capsid protein a [Clostridium botulinum C/D str. BKT2873]QPW61570.1 phage major capsid protein [Clostridium botulinum]